MPSVDAYRALAVESVFSSVEVWGETADRYFPDADAMLKWVDNPATVPFRQHLDEATAERFHRAVADRMIEETTQPDGTLRDVSTDQSDCETVAFVGARLRQDE